MSDMNALSEVLRVRATLSGDYLDRLAEMIFSAYTRDGLPPDWAFSVIEKRLPLTKDEKLYILDAYLNLDMEHKNMSGIKRKEQAQKHNRKIIERFLKTGEIF